MAMASSERKESDQALAALTPAEKRYRWFECAMLFGALPLILAFREAGGGIFLFLWSAAAVCLVMLVRDPTFDRRRLWNVRAVGPELPRILGLFVVGLLVGVAVTLWLIPERFLYLPRERTGLWAAIMLVYPVLSVVPQNVVYRAFVEHRYRGLFGAGRSGEWWSIGLSAASFSWAHIVFWNAFALIATLLGGVLFAITYRRSRSVAAASLEHAMYGCAIFTLGLGWFLYHGVSRG